MPLGPPVDDPAGSAVLFSALLFGLAPIAGWKIYPKVGQVNKFLEEKGDLRRDFQVRFYLNLPTSAVLEEKKM